MVSLKARQGGVSPRTIRKRILKAEEEAIKSILITLVSPRTIRKRILKDCLQVTSPGDTVLGFTPHDP